MCDVRRPLPLAPPTANCIYSAGEGVYGPISRPLKLMEICENKNSIGFRWLYMWDSEYCESELRAVEASGESRDELCPSKDTSETQSQVDGWYTCDQCLAVAQRRHGQEILLGLLICSTSSRPQMSCRIPLCSRVIYSVGNELLIVLLAS